MSSAAEERIIRLIRETGQPCIVDGIKVQKWRSRHPPWDAETQRYIGRLQVGIYPYFLDRPSAYQAHVAGLRVSIVAAHRLIKQQKLQAERHWKIRGRFRLAQSVR